MVTDDDRRWNLAHPEVPQRTGKINHVNRFDASFFGVHYKQAHTMDPMNRMLLEKAYEAVVDAGKDISKVINASVPFAQLKLNSIVLVYIRREPQDAKRQ